jgi:EAL domain-containing protein (putative c-di-GMP-specific phosphodiesterase class I)
MLRRYEVLLRMVERDHSIVLPGTFIPAAERYGLMAAIDRWVIENAFRAYATRDGSSDRVEIAINLSGDSLSTNDLGQFVLHQFATHNIRSEQVCFEITETAAIQNLDHALHFIAEIKARGGRFALDDFGSGLSSFRYLRELPADYLKIDGSFVCNMSRSTQDMAVVAAINEVGHTLGIATIAEYAHDAAIVRSLRQMGVDYAQGYAFGAPAPLEQLLGVAPGCASSRPMSSTGR